MSIFDSIKKCFGEGKIRLEGTLEGGRKFTVKQSYIGAINTLNPSELKDEMKRRIFVEWGYIVRDIKIVGYY